MVLPRYYYVSSSKILALFEGGSVTKERKAGEYRLIQSPYFTYHIEICLSAAILNMLVFSTLRNYSRATKELIVPFVFGKTRFMCDHLFYTKGG